MSTTPLKLVVLISGGGTTLRNLLDRIAAGQLAAKVVCVISSNPAAGGLKFATAAGIPTHICERMPSPTITPSVRRFFQRAAK